MMITNTPGNAPCRCHEQNTSEQAGMGFLSLPTMPQLPTLDWKLIVIVAMALYILWRQFQSGKEGHATYRSKRIAKRLDSSTW